MKKDYMKRQLLEFILGKALLTEWSQADRAQSRTPL